MAIITAMLSSGLAAIVAVIASGHQFQGGDSRWGCLFLIVAFRLTSYVIELSDTGYER